jgi:hypothetical protein
MRREERSISNGMESLNAILVAKDATVVCIVSISASLEVIFPTFF